jgi:transcriptional regulator with XRE-family HTH domain
LNPARLDRELARRGWNATDLARASGFSVATISAARRGRPVANATLCKIAETLLNAPIVPGVDGLLEPEDGALFEYGADGSGPISKHP